MLNFLCDVDFVIEDEDCIYLVEYKNANIPGAAHPEAFRPDKGEKLQKVAEKFWDSLHFLSLSGKDKPKKYIYILEYPAGNATSRLMIRNNLVKRLPFALQTAQNGGARKLIDEVRVVDISEWNADAVLGKFPLRPVEQEYT